MEFEQSHSTPLTFGRLFSRLFRSGQQRPSEKTTYPAGSIGPLKGMERELGEISSRADAFLRDSDSKLKRTLGVGRGPGAEEKKACLHTEREAARIALAHDITRLHEQLGTGIDADQMFRLRNLLESHAPPPNEPSRPGIEDRIEKSVLGLLFLRAKEEAWRRFESLAEGSGLVWPLQSGHPDTLPPEEIDRLRERHRKEIREAFLAASPRHTADLIQGEVSAWASSYPDRHSYLWLQTVFRGVAAALSAQFFGAALELWMWRTPEAERDLIAAAAERLEGLRSSATGDRQSWSNATEVVAQVDEICAAVIPGLVWSYVSPKLSWVRKGEATPEISILAAGLSPIDPVCGMSITPERVAAQLEIDGRTLYFCSTPCRQRFEASPSRFPAAPANAMEKGGPQ